MPASESPQDATPQQDRPRLSTTFRALRHRNFQLFFSGQLIALIGTLLVGLIAGGVVGGGAAYYLTRKQREQGDRIPVEVQAL